MARLLDEHSFSTTIADSPLECAAKIDEGAGALLLTEEALDHPDTKILLRKLEAQPAWSEIPLILLTSGGESRLSRLLDLAANAAGAARASADAMPALSARRFARNGLLLLRFMSLTSNVIRLRQCRFGVAGGVVRWIRHLPGKSAKPRNNGVLVAVDAKRGQRQPVRHRWRLRFDEGDFCTSGDGKRIAAMSPECATFSMLRRGRHSVLLVRFRCGTLPEAD